MKLKGKRAIVTGGSKGIGRAICIKFAEEGADVLINYGSDEKAAKNTLNEVKKYSNDSNIYKADVSNESEVQKMVKGFIDKFKTVDILVNNAGANHKNWVKDLSEKEWDRVINVNLKGTFLCSKAVLPVMIKHKYGRIININSIAGKQGESAGSAYCSSKFGQIGFTQCLALEVAQYNILVNAICPGPIPTELGEYGINADAKLRGLKPDEFRQWFIDRTPFKRQGTPEQVANMCLFVASDDCDFTTGSAFNVNGGIIMH